jgi:hypothetical protein
MPRDVFTLLLHHRASMATDPRDKIYGLYGLASVSNIEQLGMPVD